MEGEIKAIGTLDEILAMTGENNLDDAFFKLYYETYKTETVSTGGKRHA